MHLFIIYLFFFYLFILLHKYIYIYFLQCVIHFNDEHVLMQSHLAFWSDTDSHVAWHVAQLAVSHEPLVSFLGKFTLCCVRWNINYISTALNQVWQGPGHKTLLPHSSLDLAGQGACYSVRVCVSLCASHRGHVHCRVSIKSKSKVVLSFLILKLGGILWVLHDSLQTSLCFFELCDRVNTLKLFDFISVLMCA